MSDYPLLRSMTNQPHPSTKPRRRSLRKALSIAKVDGDYRMVQRVTRAMSRGHRIHEHVGPNRAAQRKAENIARRRIAKQARLDHESRRINI